MSFQSSGRRFLTRAVGAAAAAALLVSQPLAAQASPAVGADDGPDAVHATSTPTASVRLTPAQAVPGDPEHCEPVAILAFRGSGGQNLDPTVTGAAGADHAYAGSNLVTNGWEGEHLERLLAAYAPLTYPEDGFRADAVPVIGVGPADAAGEIGYPAAPVSFAAPRDLLASMEAGVAAAHQTVASFKAAHSDGCSTTTKFIAVGYSQGAMVARTAAQQNPADIVGVLSLGDPFQMPGAPGNEGTGADGNGLARQLLGAEPAYATLDDFYDLVAHTSALCHLGDLICAFPGGFSAFLALGGDIPEHANYLDGTREAALDKGVELASLARDLYGAARGDGSPAGTPVDVVFTIDTTGSMGPYINQAVATAQTVAERTLAEAPGSRVGLVEYRDHVDGVASQMVVPLTGDFGALTDGLSTLRARGGGDMPEAVYSGLVTAANLDWRAEASRSIVLLGDAPPHDPEPVTGYTAAMVIALLTASPFGGEAAVAAAIAAAPAVDSDSAVAPEDPAQVVAEALGADPAALPGPQADEVTDDLEGTGLPIVLYNLSASAQLSAMLAPVVEATGGLTLSLSDSGAVGDALTDALEDSISAPVAALGVSPVVTAGVQTSLSAVGSTAGDPDLTYEFDVDGDGVYDVTTTDGVARTTYAAAGEQTASVRVSDTRGRSSVATATFTVAPAEALAPPVDLTTPSFLVTAEPNPVPRGGTVGLGLTGAPGGDDYEIVVLPVAESTDILSAPPVLVLRDLPEGWREAGIPLPAELPVGVYTLVVGHDSGAWGATVLQVAPGDPEEPTLPENFTDNPEGSPYFAAVRWLQLNGWANGYRDGSFGKYLDISRGESLSFIYRYLAPDFEDPSEPPFPDVPVGHSHFTPIAWAADPANAITQGYLDGTFKPARDVTRGEFASLLYRSMDPDFTVPEEAGFSDVPAANAHHASIAWLASEGISVGYRDASYRPNQEITRAEVAILLYRYEYLVAAQEGAD